MICRRISFPANTAHQGLGQLKWAWFKSSKSLVDFSVFDKASRGPWGSVLLLFSFKWLQVYINPTPHTYADALIKAGPGQFLERYLSRRRSYQIRTLPEWRSPVRSMGMC